MTTPPAPRRAPDSFVAGHAEMDARLAEAFDRYDQAFRRHCPSQQAELAAARMDLSLLLWEGEDPPEPVREQLAADGRALMRETPAL